MSIDLKEITKAWIDSYIGSPEQKSLANDRSEVCQSCPSMKEHYVPITKNRYYKCNECGCPISKKIWTRKFNACPLKKWEFVDTKHKKLFEKNSNKKLF